MDNLVQTNRLEWLICCDHFSMDAQGKGSLIGLFEQFNLLSLPSSIVRFYCVTRIRDIVGNAFSLVVSSPKGVVMHLPTFQLAEIGRGKEARLAWEISNFVFEEEGIYTFAIEVDGSRVGKTEIQVNLIKD